MRVGWLHAALMGAALSLCAANRAKACDCAGPADPFVELVRAEQVFEAKVLYELPTAQGFDVWAVKPLRVWKGTTLADRSPVYNVKFCGADLEAGTTYLFYTYLDVLGPRTVMRCSRVINRHEMGEDLLEIGEPVEVGDRTSPDPAPPDKNVLRTPSRPDCPPSSCGVASDKRRSSLAALLVLVAAAVLAGIRRRHAAHP